MIPVTVYKWTDTDRNDLVVAKGQVPGIIQLQCYDSGAGSERAGVTMPAAEVAARAREICAAMHEAAGLPAPIMLERPELPKAWDDVHIGGITVSRHSEPGLPIHTSGGHDDLSATQARQLAALLAALADEADAAKEQEAVTKLRTIIRANLPGMAGRSTDEAADDIARAILGGYDLTEREA